MHAYILRVLSARLTREYSEPTNKNANTSKKMLWSKTLCSKKLNTQTLSEILIFSERKSSVKKMLG